MSITGLGTFNEFDPKKNYSDQSDVYVQKLETYQTALTNAISTASSETGGETGGVAASAAIGATEATWLRR